MTTVAHIVRKLLITLLLIFNASQINATGLECSWGGFNYFGALGTEWIYYSEADPDFPIQSQVTILNPVLNTGGRFAVSDRWLFSIDSQSTLYPIKADEEWVVQANSSITFVSPAATLTEGDVLQTNKVNYTLSNTQVLAHYRWAPKIQLLGGARYALQTFKRFGQQTDYPDNITTWDLVEETSGEFVLLGGVAYKQGSVQYHPNQFEARLLAGLPLLSRIDNTFFPDIAFTQFGGLDLQLWLTGSWQVTPGIHLGWLVQGDARYRYEQTKEIENQTVVVPASINYGLKTSLNIMWKL